MKSLLPFSAQEKSVHVQGQARLEGSLLRIEFRWSGPVQDAEPGNKKWSRADELWKSTCFEMFLGNKGEAGYWEFNFAPAHCRWNAYRFESYREPQPPCATQDFELKSAHVLTGSMVVDLECHVKFAEAEGQLTAVIRTSGGMLYFAERHAPGKADFHFRGGFQSY